MRTCPLCHKAYAADVAFCPSDGTRTLTSVIDMVSPTVTPGVRALVLTSTPPAAETPPPAPPPSASPRQLGNYRVLNLLGEGGMGQVFLAEHAQLGRRVALKLLRPEFARDPTAVKRFFAEAQAVNRISHENIVEITDFVAAEGEHKYYIMELLRGQSLAELLAREGLMPLSRILDIMAQVCGALAAVHQARIVHRDLKPANIFLVERAGRRDFVKLLDFGIAKLTAPVDGQSLVKTTTGVVVGTPAYMSPEQASARPVDHRTDVYAIGVILYELVMGRRPFDAPSFGEMMVQIMTVTPQRPSKMRDPPRTVPQELEDLIFKCLEKEQAYRPDDMRIVEARLRAMLRGGTAAAGAPGRSPPGLRELRVPRRWVYAGVGAMVLAAALIAGVRARQRSRAESEGTPAVAAVSATRAGAPGATFAAVKIEFLSVPSGAEVVREGQYAPLGRTPFVATLPRSNDTARFELKLSGYKDALREVQLDKDASVVVSLDSYYEQTKSYEELEAKPEPEKQRKARRSYGTRALGVGPD